jgi:hemerythrin-like domain-containing protein
MKSTTLLIQEHKMILRVLDVLDAIGVAISNAQKIDENDVDRLLDFLRWFGDSHHQAKEETILFPALKAADAAQARHLEHLMLEHDQERARIEDLEKDLRLGQLSELVSKSTHLSSILRNHIYKEDDILFETVNSILDTKEDDDVLDRLNGFETSLDKEILAEKLQALRSLEWKYLRRNLVGV